MKRCPLCGSDVKPPRLEYEIAMEIINEVSVEHMITPGELISPSRARHYVSARDCAAKRMRGHGLSLKQIGLFLGGRDHSTMIASLKRGPIENE